jgi:EpsD family peptidyl-prolyl cis-trans isomerase
MMNAAYRPFGLILMAALLAACGSKEGSVPATQVAAKVNDKEISIHQINYVLQRTQVRPEQADQARRAILDRLVEQEVLVQQAMSSKLDRDPQVLQRLDAARREVLARAAVEQIASQIPKPTDAEVAAFFKERPELFQQRKVFKTNEIVLPGRPSNWNEFSKQLESVKTLNEAASLLRSKGIDVAVASNVTRASESIPLDVLPKYTNLKAGEVAIYASPPQLVIAEIISAKDAPVEEKQAGPVIEQFLMNRKRGEYLQGEVKRLKDTAKVALLGDFNAPAKDAAKAVDKQPAATPAGQEAAKPADAASGTASPEVDLAKGVLGIKK